MDSVSLYEKNRKRVSKGVNMVLAESTMIPVDEKKEISDEELENTIVLSPELTSADLIMPDKEKEILEKNLNLYDNSEKVQRLLTVAKKNKLLSEDMKSLELVSKTGDFSDRLFNLMMDENNLDVLEKYIQRKFDEGDIAKAYREVGLLNKAMLDAREAMLQKMRNTGKSGKTARIALRFTNDSGEDFSLGAEIDH